MKKLLFISIALLGVVMTGCRNKVLCEVDHRQQGRVRVLFHWDAADVPTKPVDGSMRGNFFAITPGKLQELYDFPSSDEDSVWLVRGVEYAALSYDYNTARELFFRRENSQSQIEAVCVPLVRASYTKDYPDRAGKTYGEAPYPFYVATTNQKPDYYPMGSFVVPNPIPPEGYTVHFYPHNVTKMYTFSIRGEKGGRINGVEHIQQVRGGISGMSASYFLGTGMLASEPSTVFFNAQVDLTNGWIVGRFATFGPLTDNDFTIEAGITGIQVESNRWGVEEVTPQVDAALCLNDMSNPDIILEWDVIIIPVAPEDGKIDVDVDPWGPEIVVPLNAPRVNVVHYTTHCSACGAEYVTSKTIESKHYYSK